MVSHSFRSVELHQKDWLWIACFLATALLLNSAAHGQVDGFVEPFKRIELASDESGAIAELLVEEGQRVKQGQEIARLDHRVQQLQFEVASHLANARSQMMAAEQSLEKRQAILERLSSLREKGHASQSEIIRAEMELSIAQAKLLSAQEEQTVRQIEMKRAAVQLDRRTIRAPIDGVIGEVYRRGGEYLSPLHPEVVSIIQVDRVIAKFAIPSSQAELFKQGSEFELTLANGEKVIGKVYRVGVETDKGSSTVEIKLVIENPDGKIRSGESITLNI